jgi:hypothetical protein
LFFAITLVVIYSKLKAGYFCAGNGSESEAFTIRRLTPTLRGAGIAAEICYIYLRSKNYIRLRGISIEQLCRGFHLVKDAYYRADNSGNARI